MKAEELLQDAIAYAQQLIPQQEFFRLAFARFKQVVAEEVPDPEVAHRYTQHFKAIITLGKFNVSSELIQDPKRLNVCIDLFIDYIKTIIATEDIYIIELFAPTFGLDLK